MKQDGVLGFFEETHAPQEAARILAEAADYARQGQVVALKLLK